MRRLVVAWIVAIAASGAHATGMKFHWPGPYYAGEEITIVLTLDDPWYFPQDVHVDNFDLLRADHCWTGEDGPNDFCLVGYARVAGEVVIPPLAYTDRKHAERRSEEKRFSVLASPADAPSAGQAIADLRRAGLTDAVIVPEVKGDRHYPGEIVRVEYWLWGRAERVFMRMPETPSFASISYAHWNEDSAKEVASLDGAAVWKTRVATLEVQPRSAGMLEIPPMTFGGEDALRARHTDESTVERPRFRRTAAAVTVPVIDVPMKGIAFGTFTAACESAYIEASHWPAFTMTVRGHGSFVDTRAPRFEKRPPVPVIRTTWGPQFEGGIAVQRWLMSAHVRASTQMPDLVFEYYDTEHSAVAQLRCTPPPMHPRPAPPARSAEKSEVPADPKRSRERIAEGVAAALALTAAIAFFWIKVR